MLDQAQYLQQRIDDQIGWYERKSSLNKKWYRSLRILSIAIALAIPILTGFIGKGHDDELKVAISIAGACVALLEGLLSLYKFQDTWTQYRATGESLKYHKFLFETGAVPYHDARAFSLFVQNAEDLMAKERLGWFRGNQPASGDKPAAKEE
jgi:hypothetical protein